MAQWKVKPFGYLSQRNPVTPDNWRCITLLQFGYWTDGEANTTLYNWGYGPPGMCQASGEYFPSSRLVVRYDGAQVGDEYITYPNIYDQGL